MLRTDLIRILNDRSAWAFVGSGASIDSGYPTWSGLIDIVLSCADDTVRKQIVDDPRFKSAARDGRFSTCLSRVEHFAGRDVLEGIITTEMSRVRPVGDIAKLIVDWPFAGYITTNYDVTLERGLGTMAEYGWAPIGNLPGEVRKVSGNARNLIWHVHGATALPDKSRLVLTEEDYDALYLNDSPLINQLRGLLTHTRIVLIGFGMRDPDVKRLLKRVGSLTSPARPLYAFLGVHDEPDFDAQRAELLEKYNVDVIPYQVEDGSHRELVELLQVYGSLILKRSLTFGAPERSCPSHDPETTGLLIYNELCLRGGAGVSQDVLGTLLRARVLSLVKHNGSCTREQLVEDLTARIQVIQGHARTTIGNPADQVGRVLDALHESGEILQDDRRDGPRTITLTAKGAELVADRAALAETLSTQFSVSILARAQELLSENQDGASRVARAAEAFLKTCIERRALGVAMMRSAGRLDYHSYHMTALLQELPEYMRQLAEDREAIALSKLVQNVLSKPSDAEARYVGLALQAQFGVHLLGYDPDTLRARIRDLSHTLFLVDSHVLIPFLARFSLGYRPARMLIDRLGNLQSVLATTDLLVEEVAEHARWAINKVAEDAGRPLMDALKEGLFGQDSNAFLEGFINAVSQGQAVSNFDAYLLTTCQLGRQSGSCRGEDVNRALEKERIACLDFREWERDAALLHEREDLKQQIAARRAERGTLRHDRQVKAEAEALLIIRLVRNGQFKIKQYDVSSAFFISQTRIIDEVVGPGLPVTMHPEAALQWAMTLSPCPVDELRVYMDQLLWELHERGFAIVDESQLLVAFSPLITAAKEKLEEEVHKHRALIARQYGQAAGDALLQVQGLYAPIVLESFYAQKSEELERELERERRELEKEREARARAEARARFTEQDRKELERLRLVQKQRKQRAVRKKRAAMSRGGKKKGKKVR